MGEPPGRRPPRIGGKVPLSPFSLLLSALWFCLGPAHASPWGREAGSLLIITRAAYFNADLPGAQSRFERLESDTYVEYGATPAVTIGGKAVYGTTWTTRPDATARASGFSEIEVFIQRRLFTGAEDVGAVRLAASRPSNFESGARTALQADGADMDLSFLYGRNLRTAPIKVFATAEAGYRKRFSDASDQARLHASLGVEPNRRWLLLAEVFGTLSVSNEQDAGADFDVVKLQSSLVWRPSRRWGFQAGLTEEVAGRNIALGRTVFLSLWSAF